MFGALAGRVVVRKDLGGLVVPQRLCGDRAAVAPAPRKSRCPSFLMGKPWGVPNLAALNSPVLIQPRTVCSWAPMRPATSATVSRWSARSCREREHDGRGGVRIQLGVARAFAGSSPAAATDPRPNAPFGRCRYDPRCGTMQVAPIDVPMA